MENKMTPKEALERIIGCSTIESHTKKWQQDYLIVDQALTELEETKILCESFKNDVNRLNKQCTNLHLKDKKQTQILEVLKNKKVNIRRAILLRKDYQDYLENYGDIFEDVEPKLTETEFNLIKEWLK